MPPGPGWAGAAGSGTRGNPQQPHHLPVASASSCIPSFFPSHVLPPGWVILGVLCAWTMLSPALQRLPSPRVPGCPHSSRASRTATSTFILPELPRLLTRLLAGPLDLWEVGQRTLPGASRRPWTPQLQPQTMGLTLAPGPGTGPGMVISLPDSRGWVGERKSLWLALGRPVHLCGSALALRPQPSSVGWPAHCPLSGPQGPRPRPHSPRSLASRALQLQTPAQAPSAVSRHPHSGGLVERISKKITTAVLPPGLLSRQPCARPLAAGCPPSRLGASSWLFPLPGMLFLPTSTRLSHPHRRYLLREAFPPSPHTLSSGGPCPPELHADHPGRGGGLLGSRWEPARAALCVGLGCPTLPFLPCGTQTVHGTAEKPLPGGHGKEGAGAGG